MSFTINSFITTHNDFVKEVKWTYTTDQGAISGGHILQEPYGDMPFSSVTEPVIIGWLESQMDTSHFNSLCVSNGFSSGAPDKEYEVSDTSEFREVL